MDTIDGMRTMVAVARQQSFTAGAKHLGISTKLASKYIRQLEIKLGVQLFNRTTRSVTLTSAGAEYYRGCEALLDQFSALENQVQQSQSCLGGPIHITAPTGFGSQQLVRAIRPFQQQHPGVQVHLHLSDHRLSVIDEGIDLAIRFGQLQDSTLMARKLLDMRLVVFASPNYIDHFGEPTHPQELTNHNCLIMDTSNNPKQWYFLLNKEKQHIRVTGSFKANTPKAVAEMAAEGLGIAMCPMYVAEPYLASGQLKLLLERYEATTLELHALYPASRLMTARLRALIDHLVEYFRD